MTSSEARFLRTASLITAAALRDDTATVRLLLATLPQDQTGPVCEGAVLAMAGLVREVLPPQTLARAITEAQQLAQQAATQEGNTP